MSGGRGRRLPGVLSVGLLALALVGGGCGTARVTHAEGSAASTVVSTAGSTAGSTAKVPNRRVAVFFGDSLFVGASPCCTGKHNSMAKLAGERLGYERTRVRGGGGTGFVAANPDYGIPAYLDQIREGALKARKPSLVVIEGGTNDVGHPLKKIKRHAKQVLRLARSIHPKALLVLVGPLDVDGDLSDTTPVNRVLKRAAAARGVPYVDMRRWLEGNYDLVGYDGRHPTPQGHRLLGRKLAKALRDLGG